VEEHFEAHDPAASPDQTIRELLGQNDAQQALSVLEEGLDSDEDADAIRTLRQGRQLLQQGQNDAAVAVLRRVVQQKDIRRAIDAYYRQTAARILASFGQYAAAER